MKRTFDLTMIRHRLLVLPLFSFSFVSACADSGDQNDESLDTGADTGADTSDSGSGSESGSDTGEPAEQLYAVGFFLQVVDQWTGYIAVVDDISAGSTADTANAIEFPGDMVYASPGDGRVYVGLGESPTIQRYVLDETTRQLALDGEVSLANEGVTSSIGVKNPMHFIADDQAYFFDQETLQVVVWDPSTMTVQRSISIDGLGQADMEMGTNFVHRDGDRFLLSARYWRGDDTSAPMTRVAVIDVESESVSYFEDDRCGNIAFQATDAAGNLYLASHTFQTAALAVGQAGDPAAASCIIRIEAGADEFDADYYVDLDAISEGHTGCIMQGSGDQAYVLSYGGPELTIDNFAMAHLGPNWQLHSITLGDEAATYAQVPGVGLLSGYGGAFTTTVGGTAVPHVIAVEADFSQGTYYDVADPTNVREAMTLPGFPGEAISLR